MAKVSVLIPSFNQPELLDRTLNSVFNQSYKDYEVIVTDDSTNTDLIRQVALKYPGKINYFHNEVPLGSPGNWNFAISKATGEYIKFIHHDDYLTSEYSLEKYVSLLDDNADADLGFSATDIKNSDQELIRTNCPGSNEVRLLRENPFLIFPENIIGAPSATIYRRKVNKFFDIKLKWVVDIDFYLEILNENSNIAYTQEALVCTTCGSPHQITSQCKNNSQVEFFEWSYLYNKILDNYPKVDKKSLCRSYNKLIKKLMKKYKIMSLSKFSEMMEGELSLTMKYLLALNQIRTILKR
ncbi:MAG: hypothetical protein APR63_11385 [Desulfuromonas sp. SDB]|nr:MAG: hypothetical protein APR63_11385 [Desulfuromonas sp. SDB]